MILAIDIGGTKIAAAIVRDGGVVDHRVANSPLHGDFASIPDVIVDLCSDWNGAFQAIGIASAGLVESDCVRFVSREGQPAIDLAAAIEARFGIRPVIINDAWAGALGEYVNGDFRGDETIVYATVSTGIGAGIVHKGKLLTSSNGLMAHLGHMVVPRQGHYPCNCGRVNCLETAASGTAIGTLGSAILGRQVSAREVFELEALDPRLRQILDDAAQSLAEALVNVRALCGADIFILGGSVGLVPGFFERVRGNLQALPAPWAVPIRPAVLGNNAELLGAAHAALNRSYK